MEYLDHAISLDHFVHTASPHHREEVVFIYIPSHKDCHKKAQLHIPIYKPALPSLIFRTQLYTSFTSTASQPASPENTRRQRSTQSNA